MTPRWMAVLFSTLLASAASAAPGNTDVVRDLAGRVGPIIGSSLACTDIARPRIQAIVDKFSAVIREAASNEAERDDLTQLLNRSVADGRTAVTSGKMDCRLADRQLADLERSIAGPSSASSAPSLAGVIGPSAAQAATSIAPVPTGPAVRGVTDREIRFGIAAPFSGPAKELGRQMKLGIDTAFNRINDAGGVDGRHAAADRGRRRLRAGADARCDEAALREGPGVRLHRQCRDAHRGRRGTLRVGATNACSSARSPAPTSCVTIRPIAMYSIIVRAMRRKPTLSCTIW